jgi:hypothetical protein
LREIAVEHDALAVDEVDALGDVRGRDEFRGHAFRNRGGV